MSQFPGMVLSESAAQRYLDSGTWSQQTWLDIFAENVLQSPELTHRDDERTLTNQAWWDASESVAAVLVKLGVDKGDRVVIQFPSTLDYLIALFAIVRIGAVAVLLQTDLGPDMTRQSLSTSGAKVWMCVSNYRGEPILENALAMRQHLPQLQHIISLGTANTANRAVLHFEEMRDRSERLDPEEIHKRRPTPVDPFVMLFTAGTTGQPRGIVHLHGNSVYAANAYCQRFGLHVGEATLDMAPIYHLTGMLVGVLMPIASGGRIVLLERFAASRALRLIASEAPTYLVGAPPHLIHLAEHPQLTETNTSSVRIYFYAGAPVPPKVLAKLQSDTGWIVGGLFGWSEGFLACSTELTDSPDAISTTVGKPILGTEIELVDEAGNPLPEDPSLVGEMLCKSPSFAAGYYGDASAAGEKWDAEGWFHSGDLFSKDAEGRYRFRGRRDNIINRGGAKINPRTVEDACNRHPCIHQSVLVPIPDSTLGQKTVLGVIPVPLASVPSRAELIEFLTAEGLAKFQMPDEVVSLSDCVTSPEEAIPTSTLRKILYEVIRLSSLEDGTEEKGDR